MALRFCCVTALRALGLSAIDPCLPSAAKRPPAGPGWIHEIKHDGFRIMARQDTGAFCLMTRSGNHLARRFPFVVTAVSALPARWRWASTVPRQDHNIHIFLAGHVRDGYAATSVLEGASSVRRKSLMEDSQVLRDGGIRRRLRAARFLFVETYRSAFPLIAAAERLTR